MFKVQIKKQNQITNEAQFETEEQAQTWLDQESNNLSFGKIQREAKEIEVTDMDGNVSVILDNNEDISKSISVREEKDLEGKIIKIHTLPKEFESEIIDITKEIEAQKASIEALAYLASTDFLIIKQAEGIKECPSEIKELRAAARLKVIK